MRVRRTPYVDDWYVALARQFTPQSLAHFTILPHREANRQAEIKELTSKGTVPFEADLEKNPSVGTTGRTFLIGSVSAVINDVLPAKTIVDNMVKEASERLRAGAGLLVANKAKL